MSTVTIGASSHGNWNPDNTGPDRTFNITATNGLTAISSAGLFPAQAVMWGGFTVSLAGVEYTVASVTSTSAAVLASPYTGMSGTVSCLWYRWLWMQIYSSADFQPLAASYMVSQGSPGSSAFYKKYACSIVNTAGTNFLRHPQVVVDATTDSPGPTDQARYYFGLFRLDGSLVQPFPGLKSARIPPAPSPTSLVALVAYNQIPQFPPQGIPDYYSADEIDSRFPSGTAGQLLYFAATGNILSPLSLGSGLQIAGGILTDIGSAPPNRTLSANDILTAADGVVFLNSGGVPVTLSLPAAASVANRIFYVQKIDPSASPGTIDPNGAELINGAATFTLPRQWSDAVIYSDGAAWHVLAGFNLTSANAIRATTVSTALTGNDGTLECDCTSGAIIVTVPAAAGVPGSIFTVKKTDGTINSLTIDPSGSETIDGFLTWVMFSQNEAVTFQSNGTTYRVLSIN